MIRYRYLLFNSLTLELPNPLKCTVKCSVWEGTLYEDHTVDIGNTNKNFDSLNASNLCVYLDELI